MHDKTLQNHVELLFENLGGGPEVRRYLKQFRSAKNGYFAVIKVGGGIIDSQLQLLAARLILLKSLGLSPIVVFGAGKQFDARLAAEGLPSTRKDNLRVTPPEVMRILSEEVDTLGFALITAINEAGGNAMLMPSSFMRAECIDPDRYGLVGSAKSVNTTLLAELSNTSTIPLVSCVGQNQKGQLLNVNADNVAGRIASTINPQKVIFLTPTGGLLDGQDKVIDSINLASDYAGLTKVDWLHSGMLLKIQEIKALLESLPTKSSVSITSPKNLVRELFTYGGDGTLVRLGEAIRANETYSRPDMTALIENAFGKKMRSDYWATGGKRVAIHTERYRAAALVETRGAFDILDKFAVHNSARGEGLAKAVWRELKSAFPKLVWRSRMNNPINSFYISNADGFLRLGPWLVLWYGHQIDQSLIEMANALAARPGDFQEDSHD